VEWLEVITCALPTRRESTDAACVAISVGSNNTCALCVVPSQRG